MNAPNDPSFEELQAWCVANWLGDLTDNQAMNAWRAAHPATALSAVAPPVALEGMDDAAVIALCERAGIKWLEPDRLDDGTVDPDGFPGSFDMAGMSEMRAMLAALSAVAPPPVLEGWKPIERDDGMDRTYIPLPGGWEVQTRGKGSTFRICDPKGDCLPIPDSPYLHETLERMAREVHAAATPAAPAQPEGGEAVAWLYEESNGCDPEVWATFADTRRPDPSPRVRNIQPLVSPAPAQQAVTQICRECGAPTMHIGDLCFSCSKARKTPPVSNAAASAADAQEGK